MSGKKKDKKPYAVSPTIFAACMEITQGSATEAGLLCQMVIRVTSKGGSGTLTDHNGEKGWLAISAIQWYVITGYSRHQYNDALAGLKGKQLVEGMRRKLSWDSPSAITWLRVPAHVISLVAEIQGRKPITAFGEVIDTSITEETEITSVAISDETEISDVVISEKAAPLNINEMVNNEIESKENNLNVIVAAAKTTNKVTGFPYSKEVVGKSKDDKDWYIREMKQIYKFSSSAYEPYTIQRCQQLRDIFEYLKTNPSNFHSYCRVGDDPHRYALKLIVEGWTDFSLYAQNNYGAYNMPLQATLFSIVHQTKAIPGFVKLACYFSLHLERAKSLGHEGRSFWQVADDYQKSATATYTEMIQIISELKTDCFLSDSEHSKINKANLLKKLHF